MAPSCSRNPRAPSVSLLLHPAGASHIPRNPSTILQLTRSSIKNKQLCCNVALSSCQFHQFPCAACKYLPSDRSHSPIICLIYAANVLTWLKHYLPRLRVTSPAACLLLTCFVHFSWIFILIHCQHGVLVENFGIPSRRPGI